MKLDEFLTRHGIIGRVLGRIDEDYDKSQSSLLFNAIAPLANEIAEVGVRAWLVRRSMMIKYASGEYLDSLCNDRGYFREPASYHTLVVRFFRNGETVIDAPSDLKFSNSGMQFRIDKKYSSSSYVFIATQPGVVKLNPDAWKCESIDKSYTLKVLATLEHGKPEESDDMLRDRYHDTCQSPRYAGTKSWYQNELMSFDTTIGNVRVVRHKPDWTDKNVGIYIPKSQLPIEKLQSHIDSICPLGHKPVVEYLKIDSSVVLNLEVHFRDFMDAEDAEKLIKASLGELFYSLVGELGDNENSVLTSSRIITHLCSNIQGIHAIPVCLIDGSAIKTLHYSYAPVIEFDNIHIVVEGI